MLKKITARTKNNLKLIKSVNFNIDQLKRVKELSKAPIVIGGCGRSGTTLLLSIMSCHPNIFAIPEETNSLAPGYWNKQYENYPKLSKIYSFLIEFDIPEQCTRWCEKTPKNIKYFKQIVDYFGTKVRFVNIVRDGRDVITSHHPKCPDRYHVRLERWIEDVKEGKIWEEHECMLTIRYEDLIYNYRDIVKTVLDFAGENITESVLNYPDSAELTRSNAWRSKARPISDSSIGRWKNDDHKEIIEKMMNNPDAIEQLKHYGYL